MKINFPTSKKERRKTPSISKFFYSNPLGCRTLASAITEGIPWRVFLCESQHIFFSFTISFYNLYFALMIPYYLASMAHIVVQHVPLHKKLPVQKKGSVTACHRGRSSILQSLWLDLEPTHCWCCRGNFLGDRRSPATHCPAKVSIHHLIVVAVTPCPREALQLSRASGIWQGETESDAWKVSQ